MVDKSSKSESRQGREGAQVRTQQSIQPNTLPSKVVMSATYHELENPTLPPYNDWDPLPIPYIQVGLLHQYRTLFFERGLVTGPFEQVLTVSPSETVEITMELVRRTTVEEENEARTQVTEETELQSKTEEEFTDRVSSVIQKNHSSSVSADVSGTYSIISAGVSASDSYSETRTDSSERVKRTMAETSQRVSQQFMKSYTLRTRRTEDVTTRDIYRRLIRNETDVSRHFGLRRIQQEYQVVTQFRGPRLVWQVLVAHPGQALGKPRLVSSTFLPGNFMQRLLREANLFTRTSDRIIYTTADHNLVFYQALRVLTSDRILSTTFPNGTNRTQLKASGFSSEGPWSVHFSTNLLKIELLNETMGEYRLLIEIVKDAEVGSPPPKVTVLSAPIQVVTFNKNSEVLWESGGVDLKSFLTSYRALLSEIKSVNPRPSGDLRREERDELLRRAFVQLGLADPVFTFGRDELVEIARLFECESSFYQMFPPYFDARQTPQIDVLADVNEREYDVASGIPPVPLGTSLGWKTQIDGDARRNEFLNCPMARLCIPVTAKREPDAVAFLTSRLNHRCSTNLISVLDGLAIRRMREREASEQGLSEDRVDLTKVTPQLDELNAPADKLADALFPVRDIFRINDPLKGFVHEPLDFQ